MVDFKKYLLFNFYKFHLFKYSDSKELQLKEGDVIIIFSFSFVVGSPE